MKIRCPRLRYTRCLSAEFYPSSPTDNQSESDANGGRPQVNRVISNQ